MVAILRPDAGSPSAGRAIVGDSAVRIAAESEIIRRMVITLGRVEARRLKLVPQTEVL